MTECSPTNQSTLDALLSKEVHLPVIFHKGAEPPPTPIYHPLFEASRTEFRFRFRSLLHAIGCKTAKLAMSDDTEAVNCAYLYAKILDLRRNDIGFRKDFLTHDSDLLANRSHEIGIGITCLLAHNLWDFSWDTMETIKGSGRRVDFRAQRGDLRAIFESKGTTSAHTHKKQITEGLAQKKAHSRTEFRPQIELIVATHLEESYSKGSYITVADPFFEIPEWTFTSFGEAFYSLRHYARVLNFIGDRRLAYKYHQMSRELLFGQSVGPQRWVSAPSLSGAPLNSLYVNGMEFLGNWQRGMSLSTPTPWGLTRASSRAREIVSRIDRYGPCVSVFQGLEVRVYNHLSSTRSPTIPLQPFLISTEDIRDSRSASGEEVSIFPDGTALAVRFEDTE